MKGRTWKKLILKFLSKTNTVTTVIIVGAYN